MLVQVSSKKVFEYAHEHCDSEFVSYVQSIEEGQAEIGAFIRQGRDTKAAVLGLELTPVSAFLAIFSDKPDELSSILEWVVNSMSDWCYSRGYQVIETLVKSHHDSINLWLQDHQFKRVNDIEMSLTGEFFSLYRYVLTD